MELQNSGLVTVTNKVDPQCACSKHNFDLPVFTSSPLLLHRYQHEGSASTTHYATRGVLPGRTPTPLHTWVMIGWY